MMKKEYIVPKLQTVILAEDICLNATSDLADETPAGAKIKRGYELDIEDDDFEDDQFED